MAILVNKGLEMIAKYITQSTAGKFDYIALASGTTAEAATLTALTTEITTNGGARAAATVSYEASYKAVWYKLFTFTGSLTINSIGIFDASSSGNMIIYHLLSATKTVANGETLEVTAKLTFAAA